MTPAAVSVLGYGVYLAVLGAIAMLFPSALFPVLGLALPEQEVWIRLAGWLTTAIGLYYLAAARRGLSQFYFVTVW